MHLQQTVEASTSESIIPSSFLQVWGQKCGDRLIADVVVVMGTWVATKKGGS